MNMPLKVHVNAVCVCVCVCGCVCDAHLLQQLEGNGTVVILERRDVIVADGQLRTSIDLITERETVIKLVCLYHMYLHINVHCILQAPKCSIVH